VNNLSIFLIGKRANAKDYKLAGKILSNKTNYKIDYELY